MLTKRIIPCLDVRDNDVVKGKNFVNLEYTGNPVELAKKYNEQGADELVFLDINASFEGRKTMIETVKKVAKEIFIPFTVGGGIKTLDEMDLLLSAGAEKVSINTSAIKNPNLISEASQRFGNQSIVVAIDAKKNNNGWEVVVKGGRELTGINAIDWAKKAQELGAGEILLTSMDKDGTKEGYDMDLTQRTADAINIPVIASGGASNLESIVEILTTGKADAALAASIFHYNKYTVKEVKEFLENNKVEVRK